MTPHNCPQAATDVRIIHALREGAASAARGVEEASPMLCRRWRVDVTRLASDLDIVIRSRDDLRARARWHRVTGRPSVEPRLWGDEEATYVDIIEVQSSLPEATRRFAIAHEIGHVVLYRRLGARANELPTTQQERFANSFAAELLVPRAHRTQIMEDFRAAADPVALLRIASSLAVSPRTLLRFAATHDWLRALDRVWLDVRSLPNRHTNRDQRLRVFDAVLDRERWFVPGNRSVAGILGSDEWLAHAGGRTRRFQAHMDISRRTTEPPSRFVHHSVPVQLSALRLRQTSASHGMQFLACADLQNDL